jgi:dipeptidyl aminopeptidase/acylaminoacyl peptidase
LYDVTTENEVIFAQSRSGPAGDDLDIFVLDPSDEGGPRTLLATDFNEDRPALSPDGRWIAYESDETGKREVYVRPYPDVDSGKWQVSTDGGTEPLWAPDNSRLYFLANNKMMQAEVETEPTFQRRTPEALFDLDGFLLGEAALRDYDVSADGDRFLMMKLGSGSDSSSGSFRVVVIQNWIGDLKRLVPTD